MINNYNNGIIARKADGEILMFNEDGDWGNHFKEVKEFLDRNGKGAVLDKHGIAEPRKPKDALKRRKGHVNRYGRLIIDERHEDERIISRYNEACVRWKADCHVVMGCVKRSLCVQVNHFLELTMKDTKTASRKKTSLHWKMHVIKSMENGLRLAVKEIIWHNYNYQISLHQNMYNKGLLSSRY